MQVFFYICEYLGVTPAEFFDDGSSHPAEYHMLIEDLNALDKEQLTHIKAIVKGLRH